MNRLRVMYRAAAAAALAVLLNSCSDGGSVNLGSGQGADPGTVDFPVAYVKRTIPTMQDDLREQRNTLPYANLFFRDRASPSSTERNITERVTGTDRYDIKDVDVSHDGRRLIFAMRGPLAVNQDEERPPNWEIWEYDIPSDELQRVIRSDTIASEGHDIGPQYLPDGRILFTSTRQRQSQAVLRDEGKPGYEAQTDDRRESAFVLHVMNADGTELRQISFNQSHDLWPSVLLDGRVLYTRWDGSPTGGGMHLYTANPDGTDMQLLYGARSHQTGTPDAPGNPPSTIQFTRPREMQNGHILSLVRPWTNTDFGGDLVMIDAMYHVENRQSAYCPGPANSSNCSPGSAGPAQSRATPNLVSTVPGPSPGGRFRSAYPLWDGTNRILVSWSQCRLLDTTVTPSGIVACTPQRLADPAAQSAPPLYSAFMFNPGDNTFRPLFEPVEGVMITDLVAAQPRMLKPNVILDKVPVLDFNADLQSLGVGILEIRSVYDFDGTVRNTGPGTPGIAAVANPMSPAWAQRPARFLRIEKAVSIGDNDLGFPNLNGAAFGASNYMREILGYAPIEPDGSVSIRVPANVAFVISVLDADGRRRSQGLPFPFPVHNHWLQVRPGETRRCNGCHQATTPDVSHGRAGTSSSAWAGAVATGVPFPNTDAAFSPDVGETMAQVRARQTCSGGNNTPTCSQTLTMNPAYDDVWTDATGTPDESFSYAYSGNGPDGLSTLAPTTFACQASWSSTCRIVINYERHIHPLWSAPRVTLEDDEMTVLTDHTCTRCHSPVDVDNADAPRAPAGQLNLADGESQQQPLHMNAYSQLLFGRNRQILEGGVLQDELEEFVAGTDPDTGLPIIRLRPIRIQRSLEPANARGSTRFFNRFAAMVGDVDHRGFLTPAELRLISEWVDIGAQYFNDPFADGVPLN